MTVECLQISGISFILRTGSLHRNTWKYKNATRTRKYRISFRSLNQICLRTWYIYKMDLKHNIVESTLHLRSFLKGGVTLISCPRLSGFFKDDMTLRKLLDYWVIGNFFILISNFVLTLNVTGKISSVKISLRHAIHVQPPQANELLLHRFNFQPCHVSRTTSKFPKEISRK